VRKVRVYVDASVIGGCFDKEFEKESSDLWSYFEEGYMTMVLSTHTLRELKGAPQRVRDHLLTIPKSYQILLDDSPEAIELAEAYLERGVVGPGSRADALHVAIATAAHVDVLVSWNFKHIVNLGRIRLFNGVNLELGYGMLEIRTPTEVLSYG
jgi:hypothetical protein